MTPDLRPAMAALVSSRPPREVFITMTPLFMSAILSPSMMWYVAGTRGACMEMTSLLAHSSSSGTYFTPRPTSSLFSLRLYASTSHPNPRNILAAHTPIFPVPRTPTVLPCMSKPERPVREKFPSRLRAYALCTLRLSVMHSATACSATEYGLYSGTRATLSPLAPASARSTLLNPAQRSRTRRTPVRRLRARTVSAPTSSLTNTHTAWASAARRAVCGLSAASTNSHSTFAAASLPPDPASAACAAASEALKERTSYSRAL
mmetsp:Transcript_21694/g.73755  ORF Transcript_21694/g.73755 Transcript_21694/m.73755 type:complete len:262 (-) Transcript_21694:226-1011(-)